MTQAVEILVTKTRDGRYRARMRWNDGEGEQQEVHAESGVIALMIDVGRRVLAAMEGEL